jgi:hypothetical protein
MDHPADLLARVEAHLAQTKLAPSKFGLQAVGDPNFVRDLRQGREPRRRTVERVMAKLAPANAVRDEARAA